MSTPVKNQNPSVDFFPPSDVPSVKRQHKTAKYSSEWLIQTGLATVGSLGEIAKRANGAAFGFGLPRENLRDDSIGVPPTLPSLDQIGKK